MTRNAGSYAAHGPEAEFEPGSSRRVLKNLIGIKRKRAKFDRNYDPITVSFRGIIARTST